MQATTSAAAALSKTPLLSGNGKRATPGIFNGVRKSPSTRPFTDVPVKRAAEQKRPDDAKNTPATDKSDDGLRREGRAARSKPLDSTAAEPLLAQRMAVRIAQAVIKL